MRLPDDEVEFGDVWAAGIKGHSRNCSGLETELENAHVDIPMSDYGVILKSGCIFMKRLKKEMNVFKWQRKLVFAECWKIFNMRWARGWSIWWVETCLKFNSLAHKT
jgi:hypothetical protein